MGSGIIRLERRGLAKQRQRLIRLAWHKDAKMRKRAQIEIVGVETVRPLALGALDLGVQQARLDRADDAQGDLVLQFEDVVERAIIALGPDMRAARRRDQLRGDPHAVAGLAQAAFEDIAHAELAADLLQVDGPALVSEGRVAGDDMEPLKPRQAGDDVLDDAVDEIFLLEHRRSYW